jgi:hypothetical protein
MINARSSVYQGTASTVTVGQALPGGGTAVVDGSYPFVWSNEGPDPSKPAIALAPGAKPAPVPGMDRPDTVPTYEPRLLSGTQTP